MELAAEETYFGQSRPFKCVYVRCGRAFKTKTALEDHYRIHDGSRPYTWYQYFYLFNFILTQFRIKKLS